MSVPLYSSARIVVQQICLRLSRFVPLIGRSAEESKGSHRRSCRRCSFVFPPNPDDSISSPQLATLGDLLGEKSTNEFSLTDFRNEVVAMLRPCELVCRVQVVNSEAVLVFHRDLMIGQKVCGFRPDLVVCGRDGPKWYAMRDNNGPVCALVLEHASPILSVEDIHPLETESNGRRAISELTVWPVSILQLCKVQNEDLEAHSVTGRSTKSMEPRLLNDAVASRQRSPVGMSNVIDTRDLENCTYLQGGRRS